MSKNDSNFRDAELRQEKLAFTRLFFRKGVNKKGDECYTAKVKKYEPDAERGKKFVRDTIVIANINGSQKCGINKEGRWDVKCKKIEKGDGYVVVDAVYTCDRVSLELEGTMLKFLIDGRQEKLRTEDGKYIPLFFDSANYYDPRVIVENIRRKLKFTQLAEGFEVDAFLDDFNKKCMELYYAHSKDTKKEAKKELKVRTEVEAVAEPKGDVDSLQQLREKFNKKY